MTQLKCQDCFFYRLFTNSLYKSNTGNDNACFVSGKWQCRNKDESCDKFKQKAPTK
jgi:hypothetical protein